MLLNFRHSKPKLKQGEVKVISRYQMNEAYEYIVKVLVVVAEAVAVAVLKKLKKSTKEVKNVHIN